MTPWKTLQEKVGWFANAMCVSADAEKRRIAEQIMGYPITIDIARLGHNT